MKKYAAAYSTIFSAQRQKSHFHHVYIDAFAGPGVHVSKNTGEFVLGSPLNALLVEPPFEEIFLIDIDGNKIKILREMVGDNPRIHIYEGNSNEILINDVFPKIKYEKYQRGLCLLDPYGLHLDWTVIETAGQLGTIDLFLNFPITGMNRNVLWGNPEGVTNKNKERMNSFWGDNSWREAAYSSEWSLFEIKQGNEEVVDAFRKRLKKVAGFKYVPPPKPMKNSTGAVVYYLFFASQKSTGQRIAESIFKKYRDLEK
ncbi:MAG: three-Cys-motif partner protein TcmP [bacterium]